MGRWGRAGGGSRRRTVIGAFLNLGEVLAVERREDVEGIVVMQAHGPLRYVKSAPSHAPWITAFGVEPLTEQHVPATPEASAPLKAAVNGLWGLAIRNQGLSDKRERSEVVQALTYLRDRGIRLEPDGLMVEALRNEWGGQGPEQLHAIAVELAKGKNLKFDKRLRPERLEEWANWSDGRADEVSWVLAMPSRRRLEPGFQCQGWAGSRGRMRGSD